MQTEMADDSAPFASVAFLLLIRSFISTEVNQNEEYFLHYEYKMQLEIGTSPVWQYQF